MSDWVTRVTEERNELIERITKLRSFLKQPKPKHVSVSQWELMQDQLYAMYAYSGVLSLRLEEAQETEASI